MNKDKKTTKESTLSSSLKPKKVVGWYCLGSKDRMNCTAFTTYNKPNFIKRFFM